MAQTFSLVDTIAPPRLGASFRWLLSATVVNNIGDGVVVAAGPLLVASLTRDPFLVSLALLMEYLPALLFAVIGGAAADRFDRRQMVVVANLLRSVVLAFLVFTIVSGTVSIALVLGILFVLGTAETFADSASSTLLPQMVSRADLGIANARLQGAFVTLNQLVGPPIGAFLFVIGMALPFAANAAAFALGAVLVSRVTSNTRALRAGTGGWRQDMAEGIRWLMANPPMRTLALTIFTFNVTFGAAWSVLVLYANARLGMDALGFGLLTTAAAVGGVIGTLSYGSLERRFSLANIMRVGLLIETFTHLALALTTSSTVALLVMTVFGAHAFVWGTTSTVVRQRAVPNELMGRVGGVYRMAIVGGIVVGTPIGGLLASRYGITAPFWFGFIGSAALVTLLWRQFDLITHTDDFERMRPRPPLDNEPGAGAKQSIRFCRSFDGVRIADAVHLAVQKPAPDRVLGKRRGRLANDNSSRCPGGGRQMSGAFAEAAPGAFAQSATTCVGQAGEVGAGRPDP